MIGPDIPAHLLSQSKSKEFDEEEVGTGLAEAGSIGPQIPSHLLQQKSTTPPSDDGSDSEDDSGPMPATSSSQGAATGVSLRGTLSSTGPSSMKRPIGPTFPPRISQAYAIYNEDEDDDEVGPRPLPSGFRHEEEDAVKRFIEVEEKRRKMIEEASKPKALKREEWMLKPPTSSELLGSLDPSRLKAPRQFSRSTASSSKGDNSLWTETPAEKQQRLADEVMGKRRRAADPEPEDDDKKRRKKDEEYIRKGVNDYTTRVRGPSLLAQHTAATEKKKEDTDEKPVIWDHARDMAIGGRLMDDDKRGKFIKEARGLGDRFSSGKSGGFL